MDPVGFKSKKLKINQKQNQDERHWLRKIDGYVYESQDSFQDISNIINTSSQQLDPIYINEIKKIVKQGLEFCDGDFGYPNSIQDPTNLMNEIEELHRKYSTIKYLYEIIIILE